MIQEADNSEPTADDEGVLVVDFSEVYKPEPKQIVAHMAPERYVLFGGAMGGGKSAWICAEAIQLSLDFPGNRGYLCRWENTSFVKTTMVELEKFLPPECILKHNKSDRVIELVNGSRIYYGGLRSNEADKPLDRLKSMTLGWFGIDEASEVTEDSFNLLSSRLRLQIGAKNSLPYKGLLTSNPEPGWVMHRFVENTFPDHVFIPSLPEDNSHLPDDYVEGLRAVFPPDWVKAYLEGDWHANLGTGERHVFPYMWVKRASHTRLGHTYEPVELGVDPGRGGDESVVVVRRGPYAEILFAERMRDTALLDAVVLEAIEKYDPEAVKVDVAGLGGPIYDRLATHPKAKPLMREYNGGTSPMNKERFARLRSETHFQLRERFHEGNISIPSDTKLLSELVAIRYTIQSDRRIYVETKEEMRRRGVKSPNRADALMYAFAEGTVGVNPSIFLF